MTATDKGQDMLSSTDEQRLRELLAAYGRNPLRWPEADRQRFAGLVRAPHLLPNGLASQAAELDRLLDASGPGPLQPPAGAHDRLMQRIAREPQLDTDPAAPPPVTGMRAMLAAGMMAASIALGVLIGLDTTAVSTLADALPGQTSAADEVLDLVLSDQLDDGSVL
jgi:hypothetical protein